jgi:hypothetical protein
MSPGADDEGQQNSQTIEVEYVRVHFDCGAVRVAILQLGTAVSLSSYRG